MNVSPGSESQGGLYPNIAAVGSVYGDKSGKYSSWLKKKTSSYSSLGFFFFDQPLAA